MLPYMRSLALVSSHRMLGHSLSSLTMPTQPFSTTTRTRGYNCHTYSSTNLPHRSMTGFTISSHSFPVFLPRFHLSNSKISLCTVPQSGHGCALLFFFWLLFFRVAVTSFELLSTSGHSGSRYTHVATRSASSMWIKRSVKHPSSLYLSQIAAFGLTQAVTARCFSSCLHSALHKASFSSMLIRSHNSRIKSSQYLLL